MEDKRKKQLVIIFSIVVVVILLAVIIINNKEIDNKPNEIPDDLSETEFTEIDSTIKPVDIRNNYYVVKNCIINFYSSLEKKMIESNGEVSTIEQIYSLLDEEYIEYSNITKENLLDKLGTYNGAKYIIEEILVSQRSFNISLYFVSGKIRVNGDNKEFKNIVKVDRTNNTFKIFLDDYYNDKFPNIKVGDKIDFETENQIANDIYNIYEFKNISNEIYAQDLFNDIKYYLLYDNETLYNMLDDEFKSNFPSYQAFYDYVSASYLDFIGLDYGTFNKSFYKDDITLYILIDLNEEYKIKVYETSAFKYKISIEAN